jgi:spoIIIJ-associated protein
MFDQEFITKKLDKFVALLSINADVEYEFETGEDFLVKVLFKGDNVGYIIGTGGRNILSMQSLLGQMLRNSLKQEQGLDDEKLSKLKVFVDIGDYREKKVKLLLEKVLRKADEARTLGEPVDLFPMSAADRREVHLELQKYDDLKTESTGEGRDRFVRIIPISEEDLGVVKNPEEHEEESE